MLIQIVAISDLHEQWQGFDVPAGDVLLIAGDLCERRDASFADAEAWFVSQHAKFDRCIYVPGNHDQNILLEPQKYRAIAPTLLAAIISDETVTIEGIRLHAMPWDFGDRLDPESQIPEGLDVLVSHEPPEGILDWSPRSRDDRLGNRALRKRIETVKPRVHIFGHCHMAYGVQRGTHTTFVNVAICGDVKKYYRAAHPPTIIDIDAQQVKVRQG